MKADSKITVLIHYIQLANAKIKYISAAVKRIYWERVTLHMDVEIYDTRSIKQPNVFEFFLLNEDYKVIAKFQKKEDSLGKYHCWMNITNPGNRKCLPMGSYHCYVLENGVVAVRLITMGLSTDDYIEVTGGLKEGDQVIPVLPQGLVEGSQAETAAFGEIEGMDGQQDTSPEAE